LWQRSVNAAGGVCGRLIGLSVNGVGDIPADPLEAYDAIGRSVLGLVTLPATDQVTALTDRIAADQVPALTPDGPVGLLGGHRPVIVGPTDDVQAINALAYLAGQGQVPAGSTVGVLTDATPGAQDAVAGIRWWAAQQDLDLVVRAADERTDSRTWSAASAVVSLADADRTGVLLREVPAPTPVVTTVDGYDPARWGADDDSVHRVVVMTPTPAYGSDEPAAAAVLAQFQAAGDADPGPRLFAGFGTGQLWGELLDRSCTALSLTRTAAAAVLADDTTWPDTLFGEVDLAAATAGQPVTRASAVAGADPSAPTGLVPLTWTGGAPGIDEYVPGR
jgi:hypothetical protein